MTKDLVKLRSQLRELVGMQPEYSDSSEIPDCLREVMDCAYSIASFSRQYHDSSVAEEKSRFLDLVIENSSNLVKNANECLDGKNFFNKASWYLNEGQDILTKMRGIAQVALDTNEALRQSSSVASSNSGPIARPKNKKW